MSQARNIPTLLILVAVSASICGPAGAAPAPAANPPGADATTAALQAVLRDLDPLHGGIDQSTPENCARSFVNALGSGDAEGALNCLQSVRGNDEARQLARWFIKPGPIPASNVVGLHSYPSDDGTSATVTFRLDGYEFNRFGERVLGDGASSERLHLKRENNVWRIVPPATMADVETVRQDTLAAIAGLLANPAALAQYKVKSSAETCESNLKQLYLPVSEYLRNNDDTYSFDSNSIGRLVFNAALSARLLTCPEDTPGTVSYSFNNELTGKKSALLDAPEKIVMLYEGHDKKLDFRHGGKADICFADGHVHMVTETEAKTLRWQP